MTFLSFTWIDYTMFVTMVGLSMVIGIYYGYYGKQQTTSDYLLGGRQMKVFPLAMSLVASTLSGLTLLSLPAEIYLHGTLFMLSVFSTIVVVLASVFIYLPVYWKLQITTIFEYLEMRFDKNVRTIASFVFALSNIFYLPVVIYVPSLAFNQVTGYDLHVIAVIMSVICIFYTTVGGVKAVIWVDTLQLCVTLCTLGSVFIMGLISIGGFGPLFERAQFGERIEFFNFDPDPTVRNTFWTVLIGTSLYWTTFIGANPATAQRFLSTSCLQDSIRVLIIFTIFFIITKLICSFCGLIIYARYYDCDPLATGDVKRADQILPYYVLDVAAKFPGISGLFVAGLFSTALSTLSTFLNALSGIIYNDLIKSFFPFKIADDRAANVMRIITCLIGLLSIGMVFVVEKLGSILELIGTIYGVTFGPILGLFTLGMVFPSANSKGSLFGIIGSLIFMVVIVVNYQINVWNGSIKHLPKPMYTHGCNTTTMTSEDLLRTTPIPQILQEEPFWLFRLSFHYYVLVGTVLTIAIGLIMSWFTKDKHETYINKDTLSPFVHRFMKKMQNGTKNEMELLRINGKKEGE